MSKGAEPGVNVARGRGQLRGGVVIGPGGGSSALCGNIVVERRHSSKMKAQRQPLLEVL